MLSKAKSAHGGRRLKAFTLVELLVVVVIIGILATLVVVGLSGASKKAKDAKTKAAVDSVSTALNLIASDTGLAGLQGATVCGSSVVTSLTAGGNCLTAIQDAGGTGSQKFSSAPVDGTGVAIKVKITGPTAYQVSGISAVDISKCYGETDTANNLETAASGNCLF